MLKGRFCLLNLCSEQHLAILLEILGYVTKWKSLVYNEYASSMKINSPNVLKTVFSPHWFNHSPYNLLHAINLFSIFFLYNTK